MSRLTHVLTVFVLALATGAASSQPLSSSVVSRVDAAAPRVIKMSVTGAGFEPAQVSLKKDEPVRIVVTRKTDRTCAKEIVIKDYGIRKALPLNTPVDVEFTPRKSGHVRYACAMDMIAGVLIVD